MVFFHGLINVKEWEAVLWYRKSTSAMPETNRKGETGYFESSFCQETGSRYLQRNLRIGDLAGLIPGRFFMDLRKEPISPWLEKRKAPTFWFRLVLNQNIMISSGLLSK